jgi:hypothetical protein
VRQKEKIVSTVEAKSKPVFLFLSKQENLTTDRPASFRVLGKSEIKALHGTLNNKYIFNTIKTVFCDLIVYRYLTTYCMYSFSDPSMKIDVTAKSERIF